MRPMDLFRRHRVVNSRKTQSNHATPRHVPRSLKSVAIKEEAIAKAKHATYLEWRRSKTAKATPVGSSTSRCKYAGDMTFAPLRDFINRSDKEELLLWLQQQSNGLDNLSALQFHSAPAIREYISITRRLGRVSQKGKKHARNEEYRVRHLAKKLKIVGRVLKPPQGAKLSKEELGRFYEERKAPDLKAEILGRLLMPVPSRKEEMVKVLVRDDLGRRML